MFIYRMSCGMYILQLAGSHLSVHCITHSVKEHDHKLIIQDAINVNMHLVKLKGIAVFKIL